MEPTSQIKNGAVLKFMKEYWFILVTIVGLSMGWATIQARITASEIINISQQETIEENQTRIGKVELNAAVTTAVLLRLESDIKDIKNAFNVK